VITPDQLIAAGLATAQAEAFAQPLSDACKRFDINTPQRIGAFLGQCMVESSGFMRLEEGLNYKDPARIARIFRSAFDLDGDRQLDPEEIEFARGFVGKPRELANRAYANRNGNGNELSGDGYRYRGRGLIQLTGRANYEDAAGNLSQPYTVLPDRVAMPRDACLTAAWYWHNVKANVLADAGEIDSITRAVNGRAMLHADVRRSYTEKATRALA
jgi:putative chitinase